MIFIEIKKDLNYRDFVIRYRNIDDRDWYYMRIDIETLSLLLYNFGIIATEIHDITRICCDNLTTKNEIELNYCGGQIILLCRNKTKFNLSLIEQKY